MSEKFNHLEAANELNKRSSETLWEVNQSLLLQLKKETERNDYLEKKIKNEEKFIKVDRSDFKVLEKRLEEAERERGKIIECFQYLHFQIHQLDTGMNNYDIQRVLGLIKKSECFELCKEINLENIAKRFEKGCVPRHRNPGPGETP